MILVRQREGFRGWDFLVLHGPVELWRVVPATIQSGTLIASTRPDMPGTSRSYVAVTFSSQPSVAYFLRGVLDSAGFAVSDASFRPDDLEVAIQRNRPDVIVYDVSYPFEENWQQCQQVLKQAGASDIPVVITTSEQLELRRTVGVSAHVELFRRPDDVTELREAVRRAIEAERSLRAGRRSDFSARLNSDS
jgi:CheY-like chemotaxis protein